MGLHNRMKLLMSDTCDECGGHLMLSDDDKPNTTALHKAFKNAMEWLHASGAFKVKDIKDPIIVALIDETAKIYNGAVDKAITQKDASDVLIRSLKSSGYAFSGFKAHAMLQEAANMLVGDDGNIKPFEQFSKDVRTLDESYNKQYLYSEYKFATGSAQMADKWVRYEKDSDKYNLQYRTANDKRVRDTHKALHNVVLPITSRFWDAYYPPNGWGCRCNVVQVRKSKYEVTDEMDAMDKGKEATAGKHATMFRFNAGKSKHLFPPHNPYTMLSCTKCSATGYPNAKNPTNQVCAACPGIRSMAKKGVN